MWGQIVDATLVAAPRQHNADAEKAALQTGERADVILAGKAQGPAERR